MSIFDITTSEEKKQVKHQLPGYAKKCDITNCLPNNNNNNNNNNQKSKLLQ